MKNAPQKTTGRTDVKKRELYDRAKAALVLTTGGDFSKRMQAKHGEMLKRWHSEWQPKNDLSFYNGVDYAWDVLDCWTNWSYTTARTAIKWLAEHRQPKSILDFGAGVGATTVQFALAFPDARVTYQNVSGYQLDAAKLLFNSCGLQNVRVTDELDCLEFEHDTVLLIELLEHLREPLALLPDVIDDTTKTIVDASSFHVNEVGHWNEYIIDGAVRSKRATRAAVTKEFTKIGFLPSYKVYKEKAFWNNVPRIFVK